MFKGFEQVSIDSLLLLWNVMWPLSMRPERLGLRSSKYTWYDRVMCCPNISSDKQMSKGPLRCVCFSTG